MKTGSGLKGSWIMVLIELVCKGLARDKRKEISGREAELTKRKGKTTTTSRMHREGVDRISLSRDKVL
jgi:hypothetical protein